MKDHLDDRAALAFGQRLETLDRIIIGSKSSGIYTASDVQPGGQSERLNPFSLDVGAKETSLVAVLA